MSVTLRVCANSPLAEFPHFREARTADIPTIGLHGNVVLEQVARLGTPVQASAPLGLLRFQPPVDLPRADFQQLPFDLQPQTESFADPGHP